MPPELAVVLVVTLILAVSIVAGPRRWRATLVIAAVAGGVCCALAARRGPRRAGPVRPGGPPGGPPARRAEFGGGPSGGEDRARAILERLTGKKFPTVGGARGGGPQWLLGMELDGYCPELMMAFEFQGPVHYRFYPAMSSTTPLVSRLLWVHPTAAVPLTKLEATSVGNGLDDRYRRWLISRENDKRKAEILRERGIALIEIPHIVADEGGEALNLYIQSRLADIEVGRLRFANCSNWASEWYYPPVPPERLVVDLTSYQVVPRVDLARYPPAADPQYRRVPGSWLQFDEKGTCYSPVLRPAAKVFGDPSELVSAAWVSAAGMPGYYFAPKLRYLMDAEGNLWYSTGQWRATKAPPDLPPSSWELRPVPMTRAAADAILAAGPPKGPAVEAAARPVPRAKIPPAPAAISPPQPARAAPPAN